MVGLRIWHGLYWAEGRKGGALRDDSQIPGLSNFRNVGGIFFLMKEDCAENNLGKKKQEVFLRSVKCEMLGDVQGKMSTDSWIYKSRIQNESVDQMQNLVLRVKTMFETLDGERKTVRC